VETIKIHNAQTGEVIERQMNAEEQAQWQSVQDRLAARQEAEVEAAAKKAITEAKLAALGLDADDLKALGL
jgi:hypothetical protein